MGCSYSYSNAETSPNLINNNSWSGAVYGVDPGGCCASISGAGALFDTSTNTIMFSYGLSTLTQTIGLQAALGGTGITVSGYNYSFDYRYMPNNSLHTDYLSSSIWITNSAGFATEATHLNLNGQVSLNNNDQWKNISGTRLFTTPLLDPQSITMRIEGRDGGFWAGYYGPEVRNVSLSVNYSIDQCSIDPLSSTSCPGYQQAWEQYQYDQACLANPLYDFGCPGFQQELESQVCSVLGPLANLFCPGYAEALAFQQACAANPLYDPSCEGYGAAMALKLQKEEKTKEEDKPVVETTSQISVAEDNTKTEAKVDVGGVELSSSGEISVPDGKPEVVKEAAKEVAKEEEKEKKEVDRNLIMSIVREATDQTTVMKVVSQSIEQSTSEDANPDFSGTSEALMSISASATQSFEIAMKDEKKEEQLFDSSLSEEEKGEASLPNVTNTTSNVGIEESVDLVIQQALPTVNELVIEEHSNFRFSEQEEKKEEEIVVIKNVDITNLADLSSPLLVETKEEEKEQSTVKKDAKENEASVGVNLADITKSQLDLSVYSNQALKDTQFYKSEEIYKNQTVTDNRRAQRLLNGANDRLHNEMIKQQYKN